MTKGLRHTSKRANWTLSIRQPIFDDMMGNEQSRKGISEIEGKVGEGSDERMEPREACDIDGQTDRSKWTGAHESKRDASEFQTSLSRVADREKLPLLLEGAAVCRALHRQS